MPEPTTSLWLDTPERPGTDPFVPDLAYDDVVVGAGLTGLVTAVLLARAGRRVAVLEAREAGAVTTGNTTGKLSLLQGSQLSGVLASHGERVGAAYVEGNRAAQDWVLAFCDQQSVFVERRDAWSYAGTEKGRETVRKEYDAALRLGLPVTSSATEELPYPTYGAIRLPDQAQLYPLPLLTALARELRAAGGVLIEGQRVLRARVERNVVLHATGGTVTADQVILATGIPFLDRGLYFAKLTPKRSYGLAFSVPGPIPRGMYLSVDSPTRSLRTARHDGAELLCVGGNGHDVGRPPQPPTELVDDLVRWTGQNFPGAALTHTWSAQDYLSPNHVPFVGPLPRRGGRIHVATGYSKWGMTNGPMAALMIAGDILGTPPPWARPLQTRITRPPGLVEAVRHNATVGFDAVKGWVATELHPVEADSTPLEGQGVVGAVAGRPVATSTVDAETCAVSAVCTHLGGIVAWNDLERSWDCPLHGSRFAADGSVLEGPATRPLPPQRPR